MESLKITSITASDLIQEQELLDGLREGDEKTLEYIYGRYLPEAKRLIKSNSGNDEDAEDIFQEALVLVHNKLKNDHLNLDCSLGAYLYAICKNMWWRRFRKQKKLVLSSEFTAYDHELDLDALSQIINNEKYSLVRTHFFRLNESCQKILNMFFEKIPMREIANKLGSTEGYVRKKKFKCKQALIASLEKDSAFKELLDQKVEQND